MNAKRLGADAALMEQIEKINREAFPPDEYMPVSEMLEVQAMHGRSGAARLRCGKRGAASSPPPVLPQKRLHAERLRAGIPRHGL